MCGVLQDSLNDAEEHITQLLEQKNDFQEQIKDLENRLFEEEEGAEGLEAVKQKLVGHVDNLERDMSDLELTLQKSRKESQTRENQIKKLSEEMARQDESIAKFQRETNNLDETLMMTQEDLAAAEDKCNNLNKLKQKLETNIDEVDVVFIIFSKNVLFDFVVILFFMLSSLK